MRRMRVMPVTGHGAVSSASLTTVPRARYEQRVVILLGLTVVGLLVALAYLRGRSPDQGSRRDPRGP